MKSNVCQNPGCGNGFDEEYSGNASYCSFDCAEEHKAILTAPAPEKLPMTPESFFKITELEIQKIQLAPSDTLMVTVKSDDIHQFALDQLKKQFLSVFPNNKTFIFGMGTDGDVKFAVVSQPEMNYNNYCNNCDCGKKEAAEKQAAEKEKL